MKIGVDVQSTVGEKTGIGIYTQYLLEALRKIDKNNDYIEYKNPRWLQLNVARRVAWENILLPRQVSKTHPDLLFVPGFAPPLVRPCKTVAVLHDLIGVLFPQNLGFFSRIYWSRWLPFATKQADFIICDSMSTRNDCVRLMKSGEEKVKVVYPGILSGATGSATENDPAVMKKYGISGKYVLSLSTVEPRKNFPRLVEAWHAARKNFGDEKAYLVIVGKKGWGWPSLKDKIELLGLENNVITVGYASEEEKAALYRNCEFFIFPSLYEGFGFPVLEAMSFKKAVIVSNNSSLPEVGGNCAMFIDPYDIKSMAGAISELMKNHALKMELAQKGFERSKTFSWEKAAREFLQIFETLAKR
jgi:glycosyltransferase involved in cell wall biosynthesis